jgi:hypothetical protein
VTWAFIVARLSATTDSSFFAALCIKGYALVAVPRAIADFARPGENVGKYFRACLKMPV